MAHGKGIVATRVGGVPEVMEHGRQGILVPPGDPAALAHALSELAGDPERARSLGASARERVAELAPERIAERLDALYLEVMARGGSR
jgi:glycosyltransferase involved in cell wall biosynthesis